MAGGSFYGDEYATFFGYMGVVASIVFSCTTNRHVQTRTNALAQAQARAHTHTHTVGHAQ